MHKQKKYLETVCKNHHQHEREVEWERLRMREYTQRRCNHKDLSEVDFREVSVLNQLRHDI